MYEKKVSGRTERPTKFQSFKNKDCSWKQIELRALELGNNRLHRIVQGEDLFAREGQFHISCHSELKLKYANHLRDIARSVNSHLETDQYRKASVHQKALSTVVDLIQDRVIRQNEMLKLRFLRLSTCKS